MAVEGQFKVTLRSEFPALWTSVNVDSVRGEFDDGMTS
jgi:hypothetical protein